MDQSVTLHSESQAATVPPSGARATSEAVRLSACFGVRTWRAPGGGGARATAGRTQSSKAVQESARMGSPVTNRGRSSWADTANIKPHTAQRVAADRRTSNLLLWSIVSIAPFV